MAVLIVSVRGAASSEVLGKLLDEGMSADDAAALAPAASAVPAIDGAGNLAVIDLTQPNATSHVVSAGILIGCQVALADVGATDRKSVV